MGKCCSSFHNKINSNSNTSKKTKHLVQTINNSSKTKLTFSKTCEYEFNLEYNNVEIIAEENLEAPLNFLLKLYNFKAKNLSTKYTYLIKITLILDTNTLENMIIFTKIIKGSEIKFQIEETLKIKRLFVDLTKPFIKIDFYSFNDQKPTGESLNNDELIKNTIPISSFTIDLLTIAIGPEHHDLPLYAYLDNSNKKSSIGRISFNINCNHMNEIQFSVASFKAKLNQFLNQNELSLQLSFIDPQEHNIIYSEQIEYLRPKEINKNTYNQEHKENSEYKYIFCWEENNKEKMKVAKAISWTDLKKSYLNIYLKESILLFNNDCITNKEEFLIDNRYFEDKIISEENSEKTDDEDDVEINELNKREEGQLEKIIKKYEITHKKKKDVIYEKNKIYKSKTIINKNSDSIKQLIELKGNNLNGDDKLKLKNSPKRNVRDIKTNSLIMRNGNKSILKNKEKEIKSIEKRNSTLRFKSLINQTDIYQYGGYELIGKVVDDQLLYNLNTDFKNHGVIEIHFNEILEEKDTAITRQCSKFFQVFSHLYKNKKRKLSDQTEEKEGNTIIVNDKKFSPVVRFVDDDHINKSHNHDIIVSGPSNCKSNISNMELNKLVLEKESFNKLSYKNLGPSDSKTSMPDYFDSYKKDSNQKISVSLKRNTNQFLNPSEIPSPNKVIRFRSDTYFKVVPKSNFRYSINNKHKNSNHKSTTSIKIIVFSNFRKFLTENIYFKGESIGVIELEIVILNMPMIKQIQCGVHSERGFDISSNYLIPTISSNESGPKEVIELINLYAILIKKLSEHCGLKTIYSQRESSKEIKDKLNQLLNLLLYSVKESYLFYSYNNKEEIVQAQKIFIEICLSICSFLESVNSELKVIMFSCIEAIFNRLELELDMMVLEEEYLDKYFSKYPNMKISLKNSNDFSLDSCKNNENFQTNNNSESFKDSFEKFIESKVNVANMFFKMLINVLDYVIENFPKKVHDEKSKNFYELVLSFCYFRSQTFQEEFLSVVSQGIEKSAFSYKSWTINQDDVGIDEINEVDFTLVNPVNSMIDWELLYFQRYRHFTNFYYDEKNLEIKKIINNSEWKEKLSKRGPSFISIVLQIKTYIKKKVVLNRNIRWRDIPGFVLILDCVYNELIKKEAKFISNQMTNLMKSFINDSTIMNKFIQVIISRTTAYDINSVIKIFDILHNFFQEFDQNRSISSFSYKFDYNILWKSIKIIIESDQFMCISKVVWFLYHNSHLFNIEALYKILKSLFNLYFFKLFFHWSYHVRNIFYYFLLFIIQHKLKVNFENCFIYNKEQYNKLQRDNLMEKLNDKDVKGFMNAVKKDYTENLKNLILKEYYSKLRIVMKVISFFNKSTKYEMENKSLSIKNDSLYLSPKHSPNQRGVNFNNTIFNNYNLANNSSKVDTDNKLNINIFNNGLKPINEDSDSDENSLIKKLNKVKSKISSSKGINNVKEENSSENYKSHENNTSSTHLVNDKEKSLNILNTYTGYGNIINLSANDKGESINFSKVNLLFQCRDFEIINALDGVQIEYIFLSINQFKELENQFNIWVKEIKSNSELFYPSIEIQNIKDDVFDYQS